MHLLLTVSMAARSAQLTTVLGRNCMLAALRAIPVAGDLSGLHRRVEDNRGTRNLSLSSQGQHQCVRVDNSAGLRKLRGLCLTLRFEPCDALLLELAISLGTYGQAFRARCGTLISLPNSARDWRLSRPSLKSDPKPMGELRDC